MRKIYEWEREKKEEEEEEGEQIKSCQMEILGFKRSETGVWVCLFFNRLYVMQMGINIYGSTRFSSQGPSANSTRFEIGGETTPLLARREGHCPRRNASLNPLAR